MRTDVVGLGVVLAMGGLVYGSSRITAPAVIPAASAAIVGASRTDGSLRGMDATARGRSRRHAPRHSSAAIALHVREAAARHGLPESLVAAVMSVESSANPRAVSRRGAVGLMQLMPSTAAMLGVRDAFDPGQNIEGGARHLRDLIDRFNGDLPVALAAYNAGAQAVIRHKGVPPYPETRAFVARVLSRAGTVTIPAAAVASAGPLAKPVPGPAAPPTPGSTAPRVQLVRNADPSRSTRNDASVTPAAFTDGRNAANASPALPDASEIEVSVTAPTPLPAEAP